MDDLPLSRDDDGEVRLEGTGPVSLQIMYDSVLGTGGQGAVFVGKILGKDDSREIMKVAAKVPIVVQDPLGELCAEAEKHAQAWMELDHVLRPIGFLAAHDTTGTPAVLLMEIAMPLGSFLSQAGPLSDRHFNSIKAIARIVFQLLQFIVSADAINLLHRDIKMKNMFVVQAHSLENARLAVGDFGAAQRGVETEGGNVVYRTGVYTWNHTSPRMASAIYAEITTDGAPRGTMPLDRQLCFYNDLFGWARIAFPALADRPPPDIMLGPTEADYARVPDLGYGDVLDAVRHLLRLALDLMTAGRIDEDVDAEYIHALEWYHTLPNVLAGGAEGDNQRQV
ncbi:unnamed protein product [Ascophyllum nodosum]